MIHLIFGLPWAYVVLRWLAPLSWDPTVKFAVAAILLVASQFHFWSRLSSGSIFAPEFPRWIIILFNGMVGGILLLAVAQIALDLFGLGAALLHVSDAIAWDALRYGAAAFAFGLAAIGVGQAIRVPPLRDVTITIPALPMAFEGYTLVQLTDLHISRLFPAAWTRAVVDAANRLAPDLIVVTGDVIDGAVTQRVADVAPLADLRARDGVYLIPGNHEYLSGYDAWMAQLEALGMTALCNAHAVIRREEAALVVAGVTDRSARRANRPAPDLDAALAGRPATAPTVLLDHEPKGAPHAARRGVALQLSGHTHGGMLVGLDRLVARGNGGFVSGRYAVGNMTLYVNNGTGIWPGFALRLGRPSELTRLTLRRG